MHELAICQALIDQTEAIAAEHQARVTLIRLAIGPLAGVEPTLLSRAFPIAAAGTRSEGATIEIETPPATIKCRSCGTEAQVPHNRLICPACGDWNCQLTGGDEMTLLSVELTDPAPHEKEKTHV